MAVSLSSHVFQAREVQSAGRFPNIGTEVLSVVLHLIGISAISAMIARRLGWMTVWPSWPRFLVLLNLIASWLFIFTISILVDSLGLELSETVCTLGILCCVFFYGTTKLTIYLFLAEKVYAVWSTGWSTGLKRGRLHCKVYLMSLGLIILYIGVGIMLIVGRIAYIRDDGLCIIGERRVSSILHLSYDVFVNVFLTTLFVYPLLANQLTPALRAIAIRSLWAAAIALTSSAVNTIILTVMDGKQLGWICLASCGIDVTINAATIFWVTTGKGDLTQPYEPEEESKTFTDTLTTGGMTCTNASDLVPAFTTSTTYPTGMGDTHVSYLTMASSDVGHGYPSLRAPPGAYAVQPHPMYSLSERPPADEGVCVDKDGRVVDVQAAHSQPQAARSLPSLPRGHHFRWPGLSSLPGRRTPMEIVVTKQTVTKPNEESQLPAALLATQDLGSRNEGRSPSATESSGTGGTETTKKGDDGGGDVCKEV